MTQFIELTSFGKPTQVNISQIVHYGHESLYLNEIGFVAVSESYPKIANKIAEAQANDPLERIAVALEKIADATKYGVNVEAKVRV